ncbi:hypothetical protein ACU4GD_20640 [Cupriavidus basilensis]
MRELDRLKTVQAVVDGQLRPGVDAANAMRRRLSRTSTRAAKVPRSDFNAHRPLRGDEVIWKWIFSWRRVAASASLTRDGEDAE